MRLSMTLTILATLSAIGCDCSETSSAGTADGGYEVPFDAGPDSGPPPGNGVGEPCEASSDCRRGLECDADSGTCQPVPDGPVDSPCDLTGECEDDPPLYCAAETGTCQPAGDGAVGDPCSSAGDCERGLYCEMRGVQGTCQEAGQGDWGDACEDTGDCLAGLWCGAGGECEPPLFAFTPWEGVDPTCPPDDEGTVAYFEVPRGAAVPTDFFRLPFPNDIRIQSGNVNMDGFPVPGPAPLVNVDVVDLYKEAIEAELTGFGTNQTVIFRFSKLVDNATLNIIDDGASIVHVDITPGSATYAAPRGARWAMNYPTKYICHTQGADRSGWVGIGPSRGFPNRPGTTYAIWLTTDVLDRGDPDADPPVPGAAFERDEDFDAMMDDTVPADEDLAAAHARYAPLRAYLDAQSISRDSILVASVFTTASVRSVASQMRDQIRNTVAAPTPTGAMLCDGAAVSLCLAEGDDPEVRDCGGVDAQYHEIHGRFANPVMQAGTRPYEEEGGAIQTDGLGVPQVQGSEDVCFSLTVPKGVSMPAGGWPVVLYSHGTGGDFRSGIREGVAGGLSSIPVPAGGNQAVAMLGYDGAMHGDRRGGSARPEDELFFNFLNPPAARDNVLQGAADLFQLVRLAEGWSMDAASSPTGEEIRFDPTKIYFFGHSQGGNVGAPFVPFEPVVDVAVFSGTGALLIESLQHKTSPVNVPAGMELLLGEPLGDGGSFHPAMHLFQWWFDPADTINYARAIMREPAAGMTPKHFLQTWGVGDTYAPFETLQAFALANYANPVAPELEDYGAIFDPLNVPVGGNYDCTGPGTCTTALTQYDPAGAYDGHFVAFQHPDGERQVTAFFGTAAADAEGMPTVVAP